MIDVKRMYCGISCLPECKCCREKDCEVPHDSVVVLASDHDTEVARRDELHASYVTRLIAESNVELDRLTAELAEARRNERAIESQLCRIATAFGGDALKAPASDPTIAGFAIAERDALRKDALALHEQVAALQSREVCTQPHDNVETCGYCQRDALRKDADRMRKALERVTAIVNRNPHQYCDACNRSAVIADAAIDAAIAKESNDGRA